MSLFKATQRVIRVEERYIEADDEQEALHLLEWEDAGCEGAHVNYEYGEWEVEEEQ
ncbi:hypothetical protein [Staphylococcus hominis]|uniref:hypothetical protein n=1 Tax=Staphylococcus hominis TaxID=1290 RepID=UPI00287B2F89|nr:hypothetical protein [Staphylococcus hominis]MDS3898408.1 hypothetical protein [Staphylococcus hominis]